ncbi:MAG: NAD-dependent epimerase/dehydratase family protein [Candidatus Aminicenantes bacterium]|nr:MAG: NAD-dependent epimerase/dehydratase family protein [Candidatus Aminicenantes bacterium]
MEEYLKSYRGKKVVITGGAGCIGSNLTYTLLSTNVEKIFVVDDLSSSNRWNIPDDPNVVFIHGSILDEEVLKRAFSEKPDYVFHLAAHFANQNSVDYPETDLMVNGLGTLKVLQYSSLAKLEKLFFASSGCSVYGSQAPLPLKEDFLSIYLDTPYQITKLLGELYCNFFYNYYGLPVVIGRFFNVYGPGEVPGRYRNVIPNFIYWALSHKPLPITGTGEETRDFTFVEDIVEGALRAAVTPEAVGQAINLASEKETKIIDIAHMINELVGGSEVRFVEKRSWDKITRRRASIEKAKKILGYNPKTEIKEGIKRTLDWILENKDKIEASVKF